MEAAHILQYTEDEFLQTLDWRPHAKADYHICKKQQTESEDDSKDTPLNEGNGEDDYEDDNIKRFHFFEDEKTGKDIHIDFSPYHSPNGDELTAVVKFVEQTGRIPERYDNNGNNYSTTAHTLPPTRPGIA